MRKRPYVTLQLCEYAVQNAARRAIQDDGRILLWAKVPALDGKWLRVILLSDEVTVHNLSDEVTVHNAFLDRDFTD
jgi:hypothetical protein